MPDAAMSATGGAAASSSPMKPPPTIREAPPSLRARACASSWVRRYRQCAGRPADRAARDAFRALHAPADVLVVLAALPARAGPDVLHRQRQHAYGEARALLERHGDLAAIDNIGAGNGGLAEALREHDLQRRIVLIGHELTDDTRRLLLDGTVEALIDQNPRVEAREALNLLAHAVRGTPCEAHPPRFHLILQENIPEM